MCTRGGRSLHSGLLCRRAVGPLGGRFWEAGGGFRAHFLCVGPVERELEGALPRICRPLLLILALNVNVMSGLLLYATSGLCPRSTLQGDWAAETPASITTT